MIALSTQLPHAESLSPASFDLHKPLIDRRVAVACGLLGFLCFLPYPAIPAGNNAALQGGNIISLLMCLPVLLFPCNRRLFAVYPLLLVPMVISVFKMAAAGDENLEIGLKEITVDAVTLSTLVATQFYAPRYALQILTGVAAATILHVTVGFIQLYAFASNEFPFAEIYVNPSFLSVQMYAATIATYVQRPFGIFPEPSAMSSSLAPMVVLWMSILCGIIRLKQTPAPWQRILFGGAAAGGLALIIMSQSGHAAVTLALIAPLGWIWLIRSKATIRTFLVLLGIFGVVVPAVIYFAADALSHRVGGANMGNSSWEERSTSLVLGFWIWMNGSIWDLLFGVGVGNMGPQLMREVRIDAVFSVVLNYIYETGFIGLLAVGGAASYLYRSWRASRYDLTLVLVFVVWLVGITFITSYSQLLPIWVTLGLMTLWPSICESSPKRSHDLGKPVRSRPMMPILKQRRSYGK